MSATLMESGKQRFDEILREKLSHVKIVRVSARALVRLMRNADKLIFHMGVPEDAELLSVHHDYQCNAFDFVVVHESFDPVAEGSFPPVVICEVEEKDDE